MNLVVGVGDLKCSSGAGDTIVTYALGSCLGIAIHDPVAGVGGLLHVMLPDSRVDSAKAKAKPAMFVDTGVPMLFRSCYELGAEKRRLVVKVAGGACTHGNPDADYFQIGKRNLAMLRKLFWRNGVMVDGEDVGSSHSRTMVLEIGSGDVTLKVNGENRLL